MDYNYNNNQIKNYEQLQREYFKQADYQNYMKNYDFNAPVEEIAPLEPLDFNFDKKPNNYNGLNGANNNDKSSYFDYFNREKDIEKEKEKKKQIEYKKQLEEQILENKIRKEKEKEKRRQEDIIYEQKMKEERIRFQQEEEQEKLKKKNMYNNFFNDNQNNQISNGNANYNKEELEQELFNSHPGLEKIMKNINKPNEEINNSPYQLNNSNNNQNFNNNNNNLYNTNFSNNFQNPNFYNNNQQFITSQNNFQNQNRYINNSQNNYSNQNQYQSALTEPNNIISSPSKPTKILNNKYYISNNIPQNQLNSNNISQEHNYYQNNNVKLPHTPQTQKVNSINFSKQNIDTSFNTQNPNQNYQFTQPNQIMNTSSPNIKMNMSNNIPTYNTNFNNNQFNNPNYNTNMNMNNNLNYPPILEKIFDFFKEQVRIIQDYKTRIDQLQNERDQAIFQNKANEEKILAMERIKEQQDKMEKNFGNLPYYQGIKNNMEQTISTLLEKDESMIRKNKINNVNNNEINNLIKDITYKSKYENQDNNINIINNNINNNTSFLNKDINKQFQENKIEESNILNIDDNDITYSSYYEHNESPNPLITSTKLVKQNGEKKLMETWVKDDNMSNFINNQNYNSKNTNNSNYSNQNKNENILNSKFRPIYDDNINNLNNEKESNEIPFITNEESNQRIDINSDNFKKINHLFNKKKNNEINQNVINLNNKPKIETKVKLVNPTLNEKKIEINQKKQLITPIIKKEENIIEDKKIEKIITQNEIVDEINTIKNNISTIPKNPLDDKSFSIDENVKPLTNLNDNDLNINDLNDNSFNIETNEQNDKSSFSNIKENNNVDSVIEEEENDYKNNSQINNIKINKNEVKEIPKNIILLNKDNNITISNSLKWKINDKKCLLSSERYEKNQINNELNEENIILKGNKDNNNCNSIQKVIKETVHKEMQNKDMNLDTLEKDSKLNFEFDDEISSRINKNNIIKKSLNQIEENNNDNTMSKRSISNYDDNNIYQKSISHFEDRIKYNNHDLSNDNDFVNIGNQDDDSRFMNKFQNKTEHKIDNKLENKFENNLDENYEDDIEEDIKIENDKDKEYDIDNTDRKEIEDLKNKNIFNNNYTNNNTLLSNNNNTILTGNNNTISSNQNTLKYRENIGNLNYHFSLTRQKNPFELAHLSKENITKVDTKEYEFQIGKNDKITEKNESEISSEIPFIKNINKNPNPILENSELKQSDILNIPYLKKYKEPLKENNEILLNQMKSLKEDLKTNNSKEMKTSNKIDNINIESQQRIPRGVTATNIKNLNDMYSSFKKKKIEKSLVSIENSRADNNSDFNESIVSSNNKRINIRKVNDNSSVFSNNKGDDELFNKVGKYAKFANDEIDQI